MIPRACERVAVVDRAELVVGGAGDRAAAQPRDRGGVNTAPRAQGDSTSHSANRISSWSTTVTPRSRVERVGALRVQVGDEHLGAGGDQQPRRRSSRRARALDDDLPAGGRRNRRQLGSTARIPPRRRSRSVGDGSPEPPSPHASTPVTHGVSRAIRSCPAASRRRPRRRCSARRACRSRGRARAASPRRAAARDRPSRRPCRRPGRARPRPPLASSPRSAGARRGPPRLRRRSARTGRRRGPGRAPWSGSR